MALDIGPPVATAACLIGAVVLAYRRQFVMALGLAIYLLVFAARTLWPNSMAEGALGMLLIVASVLLLVGAVRQARQERSQGTARQ